MRQRVDKVDIAVILEHPANLQDSPGGSGVGVDLENHHRRVDPPHFIERVGEIYRNVD